LRPTKECEIISSGFRMNIPVAENSVAIIGFHDGLAGQVDSWFEKVTGYHIACFIHDADKLQVNIEEENKKRVSQRMDFPINNSFKGRPLIVSLNWIKELKKLGIKKVLPLNPNNDERYLQIQKCMDNELELVSAIHPSSLILDTAILGKGVCINCNCFIGYKSEIYDGVIINTGSQIDHHNILKKCSQVDPASITAGNVTLEERVHVHMGVNIVNRVTIGEGSIIGAGSLVLKNIPQDVIAYGHPAKIIRQKHG
jgi:sugar O-acyltransferase (sialic acid O-acetyltransferase NeuD family)